MFSWGDAVKRSEYTANELEDQASLRITEARSYTLLRNPDVRDHELLIKIKGPGFAQPISPNFMRDEGLLADCRLIHP